jgi:hypothetical protein
MNRRLSIGIGEQLKSQAVLSAELLVAIDRINADAEDHSVRLLVFGQIALLSYRIVRRFEFVREIVPQHPPCDAFSQR